MGKNKNKRKQKQRDDPSKKMKIHHRGAGGGQDADVSSLLPVTVNARQHQHSQQLVTAPNVARKISSKPNPTLFPPAFPHNEGLIVPKDDFLKCVDNYKQSFERAIDTAYEGFVVDQDGGGGEGTNTTSIDTGNGVKAKSPLFDHEAIQRALTKMDKAGIFLTDVTQPRGLGTKCAKTYVTRCLLGDEGTTYKYLGLRMFAHPWSVKPASKGMKDSISNGSYSVDDALSEISKLNNKLTERTKHHLVDLEQKRKARMGFQTNGEKQSYISGRAKFDITLINRMTNSPDLKLEPTQKKHKCSVSWHADSSLEHYSSIAVYQTIISDDNEKKKELKRITSVDEEQKQKLRRENKLAKRWSVALRVAHDSEGPAASRRGTNIDAAVVKETPVISVSLPSRSAYYLLDDFNHHHQHAVLVDNDNDQSAAGVRYASTHRLLRESHNVNFVLERCRSVCSQFHKKGAKIWKTEQTLLFHIESEWIRQFYIQGQGHKDNLWKYWGTPMCQLLKYWGQLESRTKQVIDLLSNAAMARCGMHEKSIGEEVPSRAERKLKERQKKALTAVEDLIKRTSDDGTSIDVAKTLYEPICSLLEDRLKMRSHFLEREKDRVFQSMPPEYEPLRVPFHFESDIPTSKTGTEAGFSPLVGSPDELMALNDTLRKYGKAYNTQHISDLPKSISSCRSQVQKTDNTVSNMASMPLEKQKTETNEKQHIDIDHDPKPNNGGMSDVATENRLLESSLNRHVFSPQDHKKDLKWKGWQSMRIGLEMQEPWAGFLLDGKKIIETRAYDLPKGLIGRKVDILQSKRGKDGFSSLPDVMIGAKMTESVERVGWCIFDKVIVYRYKSKFETDEKKHLVQRDSGYGWKNDTKVVYGWVVGKHGKFKRGKKKQNDDDCLIRRMRSLFETQA